MKRWILALGLCGSLTAQVKLPPYSRETLPNGVVVYYLSKPAQPLVSVRAVVRGGAEADPDGLPGVAAVTAELLRRGAGTRTAAQFAEDLDMLGGAFNAASDEQSTSIYAEFMKKDFAAGFALFADAVLRPTFPEAEVQKVVSRRADAIKSVKDNPGNAIMQYYRSFYFGAAHPFGRVADESTYPKMKRADIAAYHGKLYVGRNMILVVAGDFDAAAAKAKVAAAFGAVPAGTAYQWVKDSPAAPTAARLLLVDKPDATQTYFVIAQPGSNRTNPDRVALNLVNTLFGGRFTSMLNEALRINSGLTYGANSRYEQGRLTGSLYIGTYTKTESTERAVDMALDVLKTLREKGISAEQLASVKASVKGAYPTSRLETADQVAATLAENELFGLGDDEVNTLFQRIDAVTVEQANAIARKYYRTENLTFVLLGNAEKIRQTAAKYAPKMVEVSIRKAGWGQ